MNPQQLAENLSKNYMRSIEDDKEEEEEEKELPADY